MAAPTITRDNDIDDDGTHVYGTPRNAAWKDAIYTRIDQLIALLYVGPTVWTPTMTSGTGPNSGQVYSVQTGYYIKIVNLVIVFGHITLTNKGTLSGILQIGGLPFTATASTAIYGAMIFPFFGALTAAGVVHLIAYIAPGAVVATLQSLTAAATGLGNMLTGTITNTTDLVFVGVYFKD